MAIASLTQVQLDQIKSVAIEEWEEVLVELAKSMEPKVLDLIKSVAGHLYVGGYMAGAEGMHEALRGLVK